MPHTYQAVPRTCEAIPQAELIFTVQSTMRLVSRFMVPIVLGVFAIPFLALLFYSVPATDDFCKATLSFDSVPQPNVVAITWLYYKKWSPRWLTTFLQSLIMSHVDLAAAYSWLLLAVVIITLASLWFFFRTIFGFTNKTSLLVAAIFYACWVASLSYPVEQIYWLTGATEYTLSLCTLLLLVSLLLRSGRGILYYLGVGLLSFALPAQHEIAGVFVCVLVVAGIIVMRIKHYPVSHWYLSAGLAILSLAIVMLSPGNAARAVVEHRHLWDIAHAPKWLAHSLYYGGNWVSYASVLVGACCIVLLSQQRQEKQATGNLPPTWIGVAALGAMFVLLCESALIEIASGDALPNRVSAWFQFVFALFFVCAVLTAVPEVRQIRFTLGTRIGVFTLLGATLLGSANFRLAMRDLRGPAQSWWRTDRARLSRRGGSLEFENYILYPNMALPQKLSTNPSCWVNKCVASYLAAKTVVVKDSAEECPH